MRFFVTNWAPQMSHKKQLYNFQGKFLKTDEKKLLAGDGWPHRRQNLISTALIGNRR